MKRIFYFVLTITLLYGCAEDEKETEKPGGIYGVITDKATGEPVRAAGVQLNPIGTKTITGNEGQYEFSELKPGEYTLQVTKTGYTDLLNYKIAVIAGKSNKGDVQIEKLPLSLRVVNDKGINIDTLAFGAETSLVERSFNIFNDGQESLNWIVTKNCNWITKLSETAGTIQAGKQRPIVVTIDRDKLGGGENIYVLNISSDNGSKELKITATGNEKSLPTLNTLKVSNIAATTATFNGEITAIGSPAYIERGFVYSIMPMPTVENTIFKLTVTVTANTSYSAHVTGLMLNQKYYVRAYAINTIGGIPAYSTNEESFTTVAIMPTLTTQAVSNLNIANGTATLNGTVGSIGDPAYSERGFVYGINHNPTIADTKKIVSGTGSGAYSSEITGIAEGKSYYVRTYATNDGGTVYGDEVSFTTIAGMPEISTQAVSNININAKTATFNATITSLGDLNYTERGFVYAKTHNPTIDDIKKVASGTGTGKYSLNVSDITEGFTYYVRAYVTNNKGTVYGEEVSFVFTAVMPTLSTLNVSNKNTSTGTATFNGNILTVGDPAYTERGFAYGTTRNPIISDNKKMVSGTGTGIFSTHITGLTPDQTYYVRAYATNTKGTVYGEEVSFILEATIPSVSTEAVSNKNIGAGIITFNGTIVNSGEPAYIERGFVYAKTHNPTIDDTKKIASGTGTGAYSLNITNMEEGATYYLRAYATNTKGTGYGQEVTFSFLAEMPNVTTQAVSNKNIGSGMATFNGTIVSSGDLPIVEKGFVYSTVTQNPTINDTKKIVSGTGTGAYILNVTDLVQGEVYYVNAYVTNSKGTVYGTAVSVDFKAIMPTLSTQAVSNVNIGAGTATFNGTMLTIGDPAYTERGFVYAKTHNPTIDDNKKVASGNGSGVFSVNATGITEGSIYYVRAYATSPQGTVYGDEVSFNFKATLPEVLTTSISGIEATVATFNGNIISIGNPAYTERGFVYSTSLNPTIEDATNIVESGTSTGFYSVFVSNLENGMLYHVRAYAKSKFGIVYGNNISFTAEIQPFVELSSSGIAVSRINTTSSYQVVSWVNANSFCQNSRLGGFSDWRIPTIGELSIIYENKNLFENLHERTNFKVTDTYGTQAYVYDFYWSSTSNSSDAYTVFSFFNGTSPGSSNKNNSYETSTVSGKNILIGYYCRCVRTLP